VNRLPSYARRTNCFREEATVPEAQLIEMEVAGLAEAKRRSRAAWAAGEYDRVADLIWEVGERIVQRVGVGPGEDVLDLACGTGNAAVRAAQAGGRVVGVDITPELFDAARERAAAAGVEVEWMQGDAEALPFGDETFDIVLSTFGALWVPRHQVTAHEIARVLRRTGRIGLTNWTPEGAGGEFFEITRRYLPPAPPVASPPELWGSEEHVRELFADTGIELAFAREEVVWRFDSLTDAVETFNATLGPLVKAREILEPEGRWLELREEITDWFEQGNSSGTDAVALPVEYLVVLGQKGGRR
jgi:SAM-dependent methyltransferase